MNPHFQKNRTRSDLSKPCVATLIQVMLPNRDPVALKLAMGVTKELAMYFQKCYPDMTLWSVVPSLVEHNLAV